MRPPLDLSIIIVNWNVADLLAKCLTSIYQAPLCIVGADDTLHGEGLQAEVIVIDSASHDHSIALIRQQFKWVHLLACSENIGFVRGNNLGLAQARGKTLMLLNPDTEIVGNALARLVEILYTDPQTGVVGPHTLNSDGTHQSTRRRFPTLMTGIFESTWFEKYAPRRVLDRYYMRDTHDNNTVAVDWIQGSALMCRRAVYEQVGGLDERYIMYAEELDWCKRIKAAGWGVVYVGDAKIIHHGGQSSQQVKARSHVHFQHSKLRYFRKFHGQGTALVLRFVLVINYSWQLALESAKWLLGNQRPLRAQRVHAYQLVLRSLLWAGEKIVMPKKEVVLG